MPVDKKEIIRSFKSVTDTPGRIRTWITPANETRRGRASLDKKNEFKLPSGRHHAERVLKLKGKSTDDWTAADYVFAGRVVNYAKRSSGITTHHPHKTKSEVDDSGMTKNEIARRNWGLPAKAKPVKSQVSAKKR